MNTLSQSETAIFRKKKLPILARSGEAFSSCKKMVSVVSPKFIQNTKQTNGSVLLEINCHIFIKCVHTKHEVESVRVKNTFCYPHFSPIPVLPVCWRLRSSTHKTVVFALEINSTEKREMGEFFELPYNVQIAHSKGSQCLGFDRATHRIKLNLLRCRLLLRDAAYFSVPATQCAGAAAATVTDSRPRLSFVIQILYYPPSDAPSASSGLTKNT
ncbi:hypothetical protein EVAR_36721_1 [Eumeta japonica]|uniref:Uncharacterized protein n=1 Tax=Eumeta variegata TaxID=151549 RepID=A0A4C1XTF4_EUMVA|nr:hypothetical protein EVAR_36721_1 [Eumeta japonica]